MHITNSRIPTIPFTIYWEFNSINKLFLFAGVARNYTEPITVSVGYGKLKTVLMLI